MKISCCVSTFNVGSTDGKTRRAKPLVSIIVPTYNRLDQLKRALKSIALQTYDHYELIVIDDASDDGTRDWLRSAAASLFTQAFKVVQLTKRSGASRARNAGLKIAKGDLVAFLDADDLWRPNYLECQAAALLAHQKSIMSFCDVWRDRTAIGGAYQMQAFQDRKNYKDLIERLLMDNFISTMSSVIIRRAQLKAAGFLDVKFKVMHDRALYIRLLQLGGEITHIPQALVIKRQAPDSLTSDFSLWADDARKFLQVFFAAKRNQAYEHLKDLAEKSIERRIQLRLAQFNRGQSPVSV